MLAIDIYSEMWFSYFLVCKQCCGSAWMLKGDRVFTVWNFSAVGADTLNGATLSLLSSEWNIYHWWFVPVTLQWSGDWLVMSCFWHIVWCHRGSTRGFKMEKKDELSIFSNRWSIRRTWRTPKATASISVRLHSFKMLLKSPSSQVM